jgi:diguanylate cyclase
MDMAYQQDPQAEATVAAHQRLRLQRLAMGAGSYLFTFVMVLLWWQFGFLGGQVAAYWALFAAAINAAFLLLLLSQLNLRLADPSMTLLQIVASMFPSLYVMFHLDAGQARSIMVLSCVIPVLFGILGLNLRQLVGVMLSIVLAYVALIATLHWQRPHAVDLSLELMQFLVLILVGSQLALLGGYIASLRENLRSRNHELQSALTHINELASRDPLTGTFNRRHLMSSLSELTRPESVQDRCSVCIIDLDHFKQINDTFGHQAGDGVLCAISDLISKGLRKTDVFGRYGGEEFLLILPDTDAGGARHKADRLRREIASLQLNMLPGSYRVTASFGIAEHRDDESMDATIERADKALYEAKRAGRNQVHLADL